MKKYNTTWNAKKMVINFNEKQWRQDFAFFVKNKKFWENTKVTRSKIVRNDHVGQATKMFKIYDTYDRNVIVIYKNLNEIINSSDEEITKLYLQEKGID